MSLGSSLLCIAVIGIGIVLLAVVLRDRSTQKPTSVQTLSPVHRSRPRERDRAEGMNEKRQNEHRRRRRIKGAMSRISRRINRRK